MNYVNWLDFIEDMRYEDIIIVIYKEMLNKYKSNKFWVLGKEDKLEVIKPDN